MLSFTNEGIQKIKDTKSFQGDIRLKRAANKMLLFYKKEAETDFPAMQDFYIKKDNFEKAEKMINSISKKKRTQKDIDRFNKAVNEFNAAVNSINQISSSAHKQRGENLELWNKAVNKFFDDHS